MVQALTIGPVGGGQGGKKGTQAKPQLDPAKRGQPVPKPVKVPVPSKPAPVQKATKAEKAWTVQDKKKPVKVDPSQKKDPAEPIQRGEKDQKAQSNIIRRGVEKGSESGQEEFEFGAPGEGGGFGGGKGKGVGIGVGPGGGGFGFGGYLAIMRKKIWAEWTQYTTIGSNKSCVVGLTVNKRGQVSQLKVETTSGDGFYDNVALRAIRNASPMPPLPPSFPKESQRFRIKFKLVD